MSAPAHKTAVIIGVGPGLGMSLAHRFGREGYATALVSRTDARHSGYVSALRQAGIHAESFVADVFDRERLRSVLDEIGDRFGGIDLLYYGPGAIDPGAKPISILDTTSTDVERVMAGLYPAIDVASQVVPGMLDRGDGGLLFAGGLSAVQPMPALGPLAALSAALRGYVLTLNAALAEKGVYAGSLTIGGLIERGDIHRTMISRPGDLGDLGSRTLDPDEIAEAAWALYSARDRPEAIFSAFG
jgi:NAD(P)-dependent dehydrogenase (short-subunit alcohol dehydrogenase family)